jgi:hypothetical protein
MAGDGNIIGALIGACGGIVSGTLPFAWTALSNRRGRYLSARREACLGRWEGNASDFYVEDASKPKIAFTLIVTFTSVGRTVKADGLVQLPSSAKVDELALSGTFYNDDYVQLSYANKSFAKKQLGVVVVGLSHDGSCQRGYYTGFSPGRATIVAGEVALKRNA